MLSKYGPGMDWESRFRLAEEVAMLDILSEGRRIGNSSGVFGSADKLQYDKARGRIGPSGPSQLPLHAALCRMSVVSHRFLWGLRRALNLRVAGLRKSSAFPPSRRAIDFK